MKYLTTSAQQEEVLARLTAYVAPLSPEDEWPPTAVSDLREWWEVHLNLMAVRVASAMYKAPVDVVKASKKSIVSWLVDGKRLPIRLNTIVDWFSALSAEETDAVPDDASPNPLPTRPAQAPVTGGNLEDDQGNGKHSGPYHVSMSPEQMQQMLASFASQLRDPSASSEKTALKVAESPLDVHLRKTRNSVNMMAFVDPSTLCKTYLEYIKSKQAAYGQSKSISVSSDGRITTGEPTLRDVSKRYCSVEFRQGWDFLLEMYMDDPAVAHRVPDMLKWARIVWSQGIGTPEQKVRYSKEFMFKYQRSEASDWVGKFSTDVPLMLEFLCPLPQPQSKPSGTAAAPSGGRGKGSGAKRKATSAPPGPRKPKKKRCCFSRSNPEHGECTYKNCRFCHKCASCGKDHCAQKCDAWDDKKAALYVSSLE